jgi:hypothetical protein
MARVICQPLPHTNVLKDATSSSEERLTPCRFKPTSTCAYVHDETCRTYVNKPVHACMHTGEGRISPPACGYLSINQDLNMSQESDFPMLVGKT